MPEKYSTEEQPKAMICERADRTTVLVADAADKVVERSEQVVASVTRGAAEAAGSIDDTLRTAGSSTDKLTDLIADEIIDRPIRALGIAAAIGLFVGVMAAR